MFCWLRLSVSIVVVALAALPFAHAKSGVVHLQNRYDSQHVSSLPAEVQNAIARYARLCGGHLAADHSFADYFRRGGRTLILLHFEHFSCPNRGAICTAAGCLHQVYVSKDDTYVLSRSSYVPELDVTEVNIAPRR